MPDETSAPIPPRRRTITADPEPPKAKPAPPPSSNGTDKTEKIKLPPRQQAVVELLGIPLIPLVGLAAYQMRTGPEGSISPYALDVETVTMYAPAFAEAVADLADGYPVLAAVLDRLAVTTPFMALASVVISVGAQIAENHGKLPEAARGISPNLIDRQEFAQALAARGEQLQGE
jgi:hypothetical protein